MATVGKYPRNYIREIRESRGISVRALAAKIGQHHQSLSKVETSQANLTHILLNLICEALECNELDILQGPAHPPIITDKEERECVEAFRELDRPARSMYLHTLKTFIKGSKGNEKSERLS